MQSHSVSSSSLLRSLLLQRLRWRLLILAISLVAAVLGILAPYAQKHFTDDLLAGHPAQEWVWAAFVLTLGAQSLSQLSIWLATREALVSQKALGDAAFQRILEGPGGLIGRRPAGEAVSLFAVDVPGATALLDQALVMACSMIFPILLAPIALHAFFGISWLASASAIAFLAIVNFLLARRQSRFFHSFKQLAAERTGLVSEWVQNIRTLRILGWVEPAESRIFEVRKRETRNRKKMVTNGQLMNSIAGSATFALNILAVLLLLHIRGGENARPSAGELLSLLWILGVFLSRPLRQLPWTFVMGLDSLSSMTRLQDALRLPIVQPVVQDPGAGADEGANEYEREDLALDVRGLNLLSGGKELLKDIDLQVKSRQFIAIVGEVGSGKSLLLQSLMGATGASYFRYAIDGRPTAGPVDSRVRDRMAFVPQEGFTMSATLRENVVFEYLTQNLPETDRAELDRKVMLSLKFAQFVPDRERVSDGLETEIGERGVNLSGGQRQRIGLARAHFADRPLVLLDDCLSAVDVDTEKNLVSDLLCGAWADQTRILVTHRMSVLPKCDQVIFMEDGRISMRGTYSELLARSDRFRDFVHREAVRAEEAQRNG